ncbi:MAG: adenylate/guanylate cyclase domain-containing protein [Acidobacteriota bacterium]
MSLLRGAAFGLAAGLLALGAARVPFVRTVELKTYDLRVRATARPAGPHPAITMIAIDDDSVRRMEPLVGRWPWPRLVHAAVVDFLARGPARVIAYDVLFTEADRRRFTVGDEEWTGEESDRALALSIARAGTVVLAADVALEGLVDASRQLTSDLTGIPAFERAIDAGACAEPRPLLVPPLAVLAEAAEAIGHNLLTLDPDGPVRRAVPLVSVDGRVMPSLALAAASLAAAIPAGDVRVEGTTLVAGRARVPLVVDRVPSYYGPARPSCRAFVPFRGPALGPSGAATFEHVSFYDLFYAEQQIVEGVAPSIDPARFRDRIVIVGATAQGLHDTFSTPFGEGAMAGIEIHANVVDGLLAGRSVAPVEPWIAALAAVGPALVVSLVGAFAAAWATAAAAAVLATVTTGVGVWAFAGGLWVPLVAPLVAIGLAFVADLAWQYAVEGREKRRVKQVFSRFVAHDVFEQLMADPSRAALGGERRVMTVLFADVRGFTGLSEQGRPEDIVRQLNEYFSRMVEVLFAHRGTVDKFVGDMVMALFGAPLADAAHADHAVQAALAMSAALDELNAGWRAEGRPALDIGIGVNTGEMVVGNIGSDTIMSYTVIGDAVNLGARLEALNKEYGTRLIVSESTRAALTGRYAVRPLGEVTVRGRSAPVAIYEIRPSADTGDGPRP